MQLSVQTLPKATKKAHAQSADIMIIIICIGQDRLIQVMMVWIRVTSSRDAAYPLVALSMLMVVSVCHVSHCRLRLC